jgi:hypothetical protein
MSNCCSPLQQIALTAASVLLVMTMTVHSVMGQRRLVRPLLDEGAGIMKHPLARFIVPFAWHLTSGIGLVLAAILFAWAWVPDQARAIGLAATGIVFTASGLIDCIGSKGKHIGWAPLTLIGLCALAALLAG